MQKFLSGKGGELVALAVSESANTTTSGPRGHCLPPASIYMQAAMVSVEHLVVGHAVGWDG